MEFLTLCLEYFQLICFIKFKEKKITIDKRTFSFIHPLSLPPFTLLILPVVGADLGEFCVGVRLQFSSIVLFSTC